MSSAMRSHHAPKSVALAQSKALASKASHAAAARAREAAAKNPALANPWLVSTEGDHRKRQKKMRAYEKKVAKGTATALDGSDVIDVAAMRTGNHVAGSYMAVWSLGTKLFQAIAVGIALPLLSLVGGFDPNSENGPSELLALRLNITVIPMILYGAAVLVIWRYPLDADRLVRLREAFTRRRERQGLPPMDDQQTSGSAG